MPNLRGALDLNAGLPARLPKRFLEPENAPLRPKFLVVPEIDLRPPKLRGDREIDDRFDDPRLRPDPKLPRFNEPLERIPPPPKLGEIPLAPTGDPPPLTPPPALPPPRPPLAPITPAEKSNSPRISAVTITDFLCVSIINPLSG